MKNLKKKLMVAFASAAFMVSGLTHRAAAHEEDHQIYNNGDQQMLQTDAPKANTIYGRRYVPRSCLTFGDFMKDPEAHKEEASYPSLMAVFNSASMGREMMEFVARTDPGMKLCDMELSPLERAVYAGDFIGIDYERHDNLTIHVTSLIHEMAHHYQEMNGTDYFNYRQSLADNQRAILAMETAAPVVELIALFEAKRAGTLDWQTGLPDYSNRYLMMQLFEAIYTKLTNTGYEEDVSLNATAGYLWQTTLQLQNILDGYNSSAVRFTLLTADRLRSYHFNYEASTIEQTIEQSGNMGGRINFTRLDLMPPNDELFGSNEDMRQIFEAVEWYRSSRMLGADDPRVEAEKARLVEAGNRFINVDFDEVIKKLRRGIDVEQAFHSTIETSAPASSINVSKLSPVAGAVKQVLRNGSADAQQDLLRPATKALSPHRV